MKLRNTITEGDLKHRWSHKKIKFSIRFLWSADWVQKYWLPDDTTCLMFRGFTCHQAKLTPWPVHHCLLARGFRVHNSFAVNFLCDIHNACPFSGIFVFVFHTYLSGLFIQALFMWETSDVHYLTIFFNANFHMSVFIFMLAVNYQAHHIMERT